MDRKRFLGIGVAILLLLGLASILMPFFGSLQPSDRARADRRFIEINVNGLKPGDRKVYRFDGPYPVLVVRRSPHQLEMQVRSQDVLERQHAARLDIDPAYERDPDWLDPVTRSLQPMYGVYIAYPGPSTVQCPVIPIEPDTEFGDRNDGKSPDPGGLLKDPCRGAYYDVTGRSVVLHGAGRYPAKDLAVPAHRWIGDRSLLIGRWPDDRGSEEVP